VDIAIDGDLVVAGPPIQTNRGDGGNRGQKFHVSIDGYFDHIAVIRAETHVDDIVTGRAITAELQEGLTDHAPRALRRPPVTVFPLSALIASTTIEDCIFDPSDRLHPGWR